MVGWHWTHGKADIHQRRQSPALPRRGKGTQQGLDPCHIKGSLQQGLGRDHPGLTQRFWFLALVSLPEKLPRLIETPVSLAGCLDLTVGSKVASHQEGLEGGASPIFPHHGGPQERDHLRL